MNREPPDAVDTYARLAGTPQPLFDVVLVLVLVLVDGADVFDIAFVDVSVDVDVVAVGIATTIQLSVSEMPTVADDVMFSPLHTSCAAPKLMYAATHPLVYEQLERHKHRNCIMLVLPLAATS